MDSPAGRPSPVPLDLEAARARLDEGWDDGDGGATRTRGAVEALSRKPFGARPVVPGPIVADRADRVAMIPPGTDP